MIRNLKLHLFHMRERIERDGKHINGIIKRVANVVKEFRERCKSEFSDFLKNLDYDIRKLLKPLVSTAVIAENVKFRPLSHCETLHSSEDPPRSSPHGPDEELEFDGESTGDKLSSHINMLVGTLESVAKDLIQVLCETHRTYYDFMSPNGTGSSPPTPLAAPLPEYFIFNPGSSRELQSEKYYVEQPNISKIKDKVSKLTSFGDLSRHQGELIKKQLNSLTDTQGKCDLDALFKDTDIPVTKREEIVFKLINTGLAEGDKTKLPQSKTTEKLAKKQSEGPCTPGANRDRHTSPNAKPKQNPPRHCFSKKKAPSPCRKHNRLHARSTTPGACKQAPKTSVSRKPKNSLK